MPSYDLIRQFGNLEFQILVPQLRCRSASAGTHRFGDGHLFPKPEPTYLRAHLPGCPHDVRADALPACDVIGRVGEAGVSTRCPITGAVFVLLTSIDIYTRAFTSYCQMQQHFCGFTLVHLLAIVRCNNTYRSLLSYFQILMT